MDLAAARCFLFRARALARKPASFLAHFFSSGSLSVLGGLVAHDSLDETLVELAGLSISGLVGSVVGLVGSGVLGLDLLKAGLLEEDATIVTRRHTGGEGLHHGADGASATVRLEATVSAGVLVHGHGSD